MKRFPLGWIIAALLLSLSAWPLISFYKTPGFVITATWFICALCWGFVLFLIIKPEGKEKRGARLNELRRAPAVALLLSFVLLIIMLLLWGIIILPEFSLFTMLLYLILLVMLWGWGSSKDDRARIGAAFERSRAANGLITLLSIFMIFAFIELGMRYTTIYPDGFAVTLQFTTWYDRYYTPLNEFGNRGYMARTPAESQQSILVIGDSYAAGHGINDIDNVFAYQTERILGDDYVVNLNAGIGISPTVAEMVEPYPVAPDILVLSHFINDIEHTGVPGVETYTEFHPNALTSWFTSRYFLFSFLYWHYYVGPQMVSSYANELLAAYDDDAKWAAHEARLQEFVDYANERGIPLLVIVWPTLNDLDLSAEANQRVEDFFSSRGATVVNIRPAIAELSVEQRMINNFDAHPSEQVHALVAQALAQAILNLNQP